MTPIIVAMILWIMCGLAALDLQIYKHGPLPLNIAWLAYPIFTIGGALSLLALWINRFDDLCEQNPWR